MRIGIVTYWFNRGQATVSRHLRSIFDSLGNETFVLARPTKDQFIIPSFIDRQDVWNQPRVTPASQYNIPADEYIRWASDNELEIVFFDQNYQFDEIARLREMNIRTVGRFVWEAFGPEHAADAKRAFDIVYSLTECEHQRYKTLGINSRMMHWGCHPELFEAQPAPPPTPTNDITFFYPGGFLSKRKPTQTVIDAFTKVRAQNRTDFRLLIKAQHPKRGPDIAAAVGGGEGRDARITVITQDLPVAEYYRLFASSDVCIAPSRWEGLGLHLYEATAFGLPIITNDDPPMNELVRHGHNGLLVKSRTVGQTPSGIPSREPDVDSLAAAMTQLLDDTVRENLSRNASQMASSELSWKHTTTAFANLLSSIHPAPLENVT